MPYMSTCSTYGSFCSNKKYRLPNVFAVDSGINVLDFLLFLALRLSSDIRLVNTEQLQDEQTHDGEAGRQREDAR